jgi:hypothetical protein
MRLRGRKLTKRKTKKYHCPFCRIAIVKYFLEFPQTFCSKNDKIDNNFKFEYYCKEGDLRDRRKKNQDSNLKVSIEEFIVNAPRITARGSTV